ncbi:MAG: hypothetical protein H6627_07825 [Calditrichae bacterium]|nr:hypothetical protein [Calditrichia bacterium]
MNWITLNPVDMKRLKDARLQIHQAAQLIASTAISFIPKKEDDSHTNMEWIHDLSAFAGKEFGDRKKFKLALRPADMCYLFLNQNGQILDELKLDNKTGQQAVLWLKEKFNQNDLDFSPFTLSRHYEIPETEQADGKKYHLFNVSVFSELSAQFANAEILLQKLSSNFENSSPIRCWPHHFDHAMMISIDSKSDPAKSIGVGFSPGDDNYQQPYYYVYPWPYPDVNTLAKYKLPEGTHWHTEGFISAIVTSETYINATDTQKYLEDFLGKATKIAQIILS